MKKLIAVVFAIFLITGCNKETTDQTDKSDYIAYKSELVSKDEFTTTEELNCDIIISLDRIDEDKISYTTTISNPKENMNNIKMLVVHNYFTEDVFPTIGVFDTNTKTLLVESENNIILVGYIDTTKDIKSLNLELKVWLEYTDDEGNIKDIYYKTTK